MPALPNPSDRLIQAARRLATAVQTLRFSPPVAHVYNPLDYAWPVHEAYLRRYGGKRGARPREVVFVGMNPGPFGMMQTGVPFGEIAAVRDWMHLNGTITAPSHQHPKRRIEGFECHRSEVSGKRLWGWAAARFGQPEAFFERCFVLNYCPLAFLEASGRNFTPERLPAAERSPLLAACDTHLREAVQALAPRWVIGIGAWAARRTREALAPLAETAPRIDTILHPSPASPIANRGWAPAVDRRLDELGILREASGLKQG